MNPYAEILPQLENRGIQRDGPWHLACHSISVPTSIGLGHWTEPRRRKENVDMANQKNPSTQDTQSGSMQRGQASPPSRQQGSLSRRDPGGLWAASPFTSVFQRWNDEMDRLFEDFGFGRGIGRAQQNVGVWSPQLEMFQRGNELVARADLPGLSKD